MNERSCVKLEELDYLLKQVIRNPWGFTYADEEMLIFYLNHTRTGQAHLELALRISPQSGHALFYNTNPSATMPKEYLKWVNAFQQISRNGALPLPILIKAIRWLVELKLCPNHDKENAVWMEDNTCVYCDKDKIEMELFLRNLNNDVDSDCGKKFPTQDQVLESIGLRRLSRTDQEHSLRKSKRKKRSSSHLETGVADGQALFRRYRKDVVDLFFTKRMETYRSIGRDELLEGNKNTSKVLKRWQMIFQENYWLAPDYIFQYEMEDDDENEEESLKSLLARVMQNEKEIIRLQQLLLFKFSFLRDILVKFPQCLPSRFNKY